MKAKSTKILVIVAFVLLVVVGAVFALGRYGKIGASMLADRPPTKTALVSLGNHEWYEGEYSKSDNIGRYGYLDVISRGFFSDVSILEKHGLVRANDGYVYAFGKANNSATLNGKKANTITRPYKISNMKVGLIAAGADHSLITNENNTKIYSWGGNGVGQLGNGVNRDSANIIGVKNLTNIKYIAAGHYVSYAVTHDGVYAWGDNKSGQLGQGTLKGSSNTPLKVKLPSKAFVSVDTSGTSQIALGTDGTVYTWGPENPTPAEVQGLPRAKGVAVSASGAYLALDKDDQVWVWGNTSAFSSSTEFGKDSYKEPVKLMGGSNIKLIDAGSSSITLVDRNNRVLTTGRNEYGNVGPYQIYDSVLRTSAYNVLRTPTPVFIANDCNNGCMGRQRYSQITDVKAISTGNMGSLILGAVGHM